MRRRLTALLLILLLVSGVALSRAEAAKVEDVSATMGENTVRYPQLSGLPDSSVQKKINDGVVQSGGIPSLLVKLTTGGSLQADYQCFWNEWIFSTLLTVEEKQAGSRRKQSETALTYDLSDGEKLTLDRLFSAAGGFLHHGRMGDYLPLSVRPAGFCQRRGGSGAVLL